MAPSARAGRNYTQWNQTRPGGGDAGASGPCPPTPAAAQEKESHAERGEPRRTKPGQSNPAAARTRHPDSGRGPTRVHRAFPVRVRAAPTTRPSTAAAARAVRPLPRGAVKSMKRRRRACGVGPAELAQEQRREHQRHRLEGPAPRGAAAAERGGPRSRRPGAGKARALQRGAEMEAEVRGREHPAPITANPRYPARRGRTASSAGGKREVHHEAPPARPPRPSTISAGNTGPRRRSATRGETQGERRRQGHRAARIAQQMKRRGQPHRRRGRHQERAHSGVCPQLDESP